MCVIFQIVDLEKSIAELETQIRNDQNEWMRLQNNIIIMSEKHTCQLNEIHLGRKR